MRTKRFISALLTGYGTVGANVVFTLASVPLVLQYLGAEHLGLWVLATQITNYLSLMTLGVSSSVWRHLVDHKDDVESAAYSENLITGGILFGVLGLLVAVCGVLIAYFIPSYIGVPKGLEKEFFYLLSQLSLVSGVSVILLAVSAPLRAFQRQDIINIGNAGTVLLSLILLWLGLSRGAGVSSFALAQIPAALGVPLAYFLICKKKAYYPKQIRWSIPSKTTVMDVLSFTRDSFFVQCGTVSVNSCLLIILSKFVGIQAAAAYAVASKLPAMGRDLLSAPIAAATQGLIELYVRGEIQKFIIKYRQLIELTVIAALILSVALATGNSAFVSLWTGGAIDWSSSGDLCLALLLILRAFNVSLINVFAVVKRLKGIRFIYFLELSILIPTTILSAQAYGVLGVLVAAIVVQLLTSSIVLSWMASRELGSMVFYWKLITIGVSLMCVCATGLSMTSELYWTYQFIYILIGTAFTSIFLWLFCVSRGIKLIVRGILCKRGYI